MFDDGSCASFVLGVVILLFNEVSGKICEEYGQHCESTAKCCGKRCCTSDYNASMITYYRWNLWNMWYFWFIIVFILMSCFGGCGYYKRRQMLFARQRPMPALSTLPPRAARRGVRVPVTVAIPIYPNGYAYTGPAMPAMETGSYLMEPPPYSEVVSKPDLYPVNKTDLPPYPGQPVAPYDGQHVATCPGQPVVPYAGQPVTPYSGQAVMSRNAPPYPVQPVMPRETLQRSENQFSCSGRNVPEASVDPSMPPVPPYSEVVDNTVAYARPEMTQIPSADTAKPAQPSQDDDTVPK